MRKSNFAVKDGKKKKMCLFCCIRKAGREHAERTVWCDDFVLFSVLSLEGIKIFHTAANLKALELEKKRFSPSSSTAPTASSSGHQHGYGTAIPPSPTPITGETPVSGRWTELAENTPGLSQVPRANHLIVFKSRAYLFSV